VNASDNEVRVSAELPGMDEKEVEVLVDNDVLTIRGGPRRTKRSGPPAQGGSSHSRNTEPTARLAAPMRRS